jgi:hypothetical protein
LSSLRTSPRKVGCLVSGGEERVLERTGTKAYFESLQQERVRPRKRKSQPLALPIELPDDDGQPIVLRE